ncbi:MAG: hypothetical protein WA459_04345 [Stellaceae bacterium]
MADASHHSLPAGRQAALSWASLRLVAAQWRRYWLRDPLLGFLNLALTRGLRQLPLDWISAVGGFLGVANQRYRFRAQGERAQRAYVVLSPAGTCAREAEQAVKRLYDHVGRAMLEFSVLDRLGPEGRIAVAGAEHLLTARAAGQPVIVMGLHLGNWETIGPSMIGLGIGFHAIYQPQRNRFDDRIARRARERYGAILLRPGIAATRAAHRHLTSTRGVLLIYGDDERRRYVNAPLFGREVRPRANILNVVRFAWVSGAAVIPAYALRLGGARFRVTYLPPVALTPPGDNHAASLNENVERLDRVITPVVRAHLDQWYMLLDY